MPSKSNHTTRELEMYMQAFILMWDSLT